MQLRSDILYIVVTHHQFSSTSFFNDAVIEKSGTSRKEVCFFLKQRLKLTTPIATTSTHEEQGDHNADERPDTVTFRWEAQLFRCQGLVEEMAYWPTAPIIGTA